MTEMPTPLLVLTAVLLALAVAAISFGLIRRGDRPDAGTVTLIGGGFLWFLAGAIVTATTAVAGVVLMLIGAAVVVYGNVAARTPDSGEPADDADEDDPVCPGYPSWSEGSPYLRFPAAFHRRHNRRD